ncbi:KAP family P-loop NTPase fold protein [Maribacter stanieri]|uniref:KAP family P-loop NTPase fold protein n=1 Tax=Maribacter stanieri TaxID=440514 RepID=UPI002493EB8C|nr:P-loop NTPase fold protein [Maribacter stanieri]
MSQSKYFHSNEAIINLEDDLYNYSPYALKIQESIKNSGFTDEPMVFGLFGKWGEGKSSFLNLVFNKLEINTDDNAKKIIKYRFNPWRYSTEDKSLIEFFKGLIKVIQNDYKLEDENKLVLLLKKYTSSILSGTSLEIETGINIGFKSTIKTTYTPKKTLDYLKKSEENDIEEQKKEIDKLLSTYNFRIVIFVDDVDRLTKTEIYNLFRLIKLTASFKNITYILSFDKDMVAKAIYSNYGDTVEDGYKYIEKIVNIPLMLPKVPSHKILESFKSGLSLVFQKNQIELQTTSEKNVSHSYENGTYRFYFEINGVEKYISTPRELVRLLNTFSVDLIALKNEINYADLLWLELLKIKYPKAYDFIKNNSADFVLNDVNNSNEQQLNNRLNYFFENSSFSVIDTNNIRGIVLTLFPYNKSDHLASLILKTSDVFNVKNDVSLSKIERRINHKDIYDIFFSFHNIGKVSYKDLEALINQLDGDSFSNSEQYFLNLVQNNDKEVLRYELIDKLKNIPANKTKENFIKLLLSKVDSLINSNLKDDLKGSTRQSLILEIIENVTSFEDQFRFDMIAPYIQEFEIDDLLYVRKGLYHDKFEGTDTQYRFDSYFIDMVKQKYSNRSIYDESFQGHITRSILSIWYGINSTELQEYLKKNITKNNLITFLKSFPTMWNGRGGSYIDNFTKKEFDYLKKYIDPKFIYEIIDSSFPPNENSNSKEIYPDPEKREDGLFLEQFLYTYNVSIK